VKRRGQRPLPARQVKQRRMAHLQPPATVSKVIVI
jgi:hypothetical protein